jgi:hypothetical protein
MDLLFNTCYEEIIDVGSKIEAFQESYLICSHQLKVGLLMILYLLKLRFNMNDKDAELISNAFMTENINNDDGIGWEEITYANINYILKVVIRKEGNPQVGLVPLDDVSKFKKHMTILFDKISKEGGKLSTGEEQAPGEKERSSKKKK